MKENDKREVVMALIGRFKDGDEDAFAELYMATKDDIARFIRYRFNSLDEEQVKDILQLSYIKIAANLMEFRKTEKFMGWAFEIAKNTGLNYIRSEKKYVYLDTIKTGDNEWLSEMPDEAGDVDPYHSAYVTEIRNAILSGISEMEKGMRETFKLFYFEHLKMEEIAEVQKLKIGTVKSRLHNARMRLREKLKEYEK